MCRFMAAMAFSIWQCVTFLSPSISPSLGPVLLSTYMFSIFHIFKVKIHLQHSVTANQPCYGIPCRLFEGYLIYHVSLKTNRITTKNKREDKSHIWSEKIYESEFYSFVGCSARAGDHSKPVFFDIKQFSNSFFRHQAEVLQASSSFPTVFFNVCFPTVFSGYVKCSYKLTHIFIYCCRIVEHRLYTCTSTRVCSYVVNYKISQTFALINLHNLMRFTSRPNYAVKSTIYCIIRFICEATCTNTCSSDIHLLLYYSI